MASQLEKMQPRAIRRISSRLVRSLQLSLAPSAAPRYMPTPSKCSAARKHSQPSAEDSNRHGAWRERTLCLKSLVLPCSARTGRWGQRDPPGPNAGRQSRRRSPQAGTTEGLRRPFGLWFLSRQGPSNSPPRVTGQSPRSLAQDFAATPERYAHCRFWRKGRCVCAGVLLDFATEVATSRLKLQELQIPQTSPQVPQGAAEA